MTILSHHTSQHNVGVTLAKSTFGLQWYYVDVVGPFGSVYFTERYGVKEKAKALKDYNSYVKKYP